MINRTYHMSVREYNPHDKTQFVYANDTITIKSFKPKPTLAANLLLSKLGKVTNMLIDKPNPWVTITNIEVVSFSRVD